jgi:ubiquinone/menaquinone biosynthesis C-methylase UbiE
MAKKRTYVYRVSQKRWFEAQKWELACWKKIDRYTPPQSLIQQFLQKLLEKTYLRLEPIKEPDDWNFWWQEKFNNYKFLPSVVENAIEVGCGPFTNMRLISKKIKVGHIVCSDPLARQYIKLNRGWLSWAYRNNRVLIDDQSLETIPFATNYFDLAVMINVLDHVQDVRRCLKQAIRIIKPGGLLLVGQDLTSAEDLSRWPNLKDIGHPISISQHTLDKILLPRFKPIMYKVLPRDEGRNPPYHYGTYIFAGKKKLKQKD